VWYVSVNRDEDRYKGEGVRKTEELNLALILLSFVESVWANIMDNYILESLSTQELNYNIVDNYVYQ
jgi:hypothetical protein